MGRLKTECSNVWQRRILKELYAKIKYIFNQSTCKRFDAKSWQSSLSSIQRCSWLEALPHLPILHFFIDLNVFWMFNKHCLWLLPGAFSGPPPISHFSTSHLPLDRDRGVHPRQPPGNETAVHEDVERDKSVKVEHLFQRDKSGKSEAFTWEQKPR